MRKTFGILTAGAATVAFAAAAVAQDGLVESSGFWIQAEGTLTASDTNPLFGNPSGYPEVIHPDVPYGVDADPNYDWMILETMVSEPVHRYPYYLWPANAPAGNIPFGSHEQGYAMGTLYVWEDTNGADPSNWARGRFLFFAQIGMNHQENDGHSAISMWINGWNQAPKAGPWGLELKGSAMHGEWGPWIDEYGLGWIIEGSGAIMNYPRVGGIRRFDWYNEGVFDSIRFEAVSRRSGDMNLTGRVDSFDIEAFMNVFYGNDHDETREDLADYDRDGDCDIMDMQYFLNDLLFGGG
ncbi:MAG: hypothetical protein ACR2GY_06515 [Phycisphaerales bacterium]